MKTIRLFFVTAMMLSMCLTSVNATKVVYVGQLYGVNLDPAYTYVQNYCTNNGYVIANRCQAPTLGQTELTSADLTDADLLVVSSNLSSNVDSMAVITNAIANGKPSIPIITWSPIFNTSLKMTKTNGYKSSKGYKLNVFAANASHPLAAGKTGINNVYDFAVGVTASTTSGDNKNDVFTTDLSSLGGSVIIIGEKVNTNPPNQVTYFAYDKGTYLSDGTTLAPGRRVGFFFSQWTSLGIYNTNTDAFWNAAFNWAIQDLSTGTNLTSNQSYKVSGNNLILDNQNCSVKILNTIGQTIIDYPAANTTTFSLATLDKGVYLTSVYNKATNKSYSFKFIK